MIFCLITIEDLSKSILEKATMQSASDIHFCPYKDKADIFYRIIGQRKLQHHIPISDYAPLLSYFKFISGMDLGETRKPQNGVMTFQSHQKHYMLRLSTLPTNGTESLAIRILPQDQSLLLDDLFLFPSQLIKIKRWLKNKAGIILFTGPTGSGKTTTLYALLQSLLHEHSFQTITLEDPIEKPLEDILQVQVNEKAGISYDAGLKAALRHDPDIIMVGEIRDQQTAKFAFQAAHTGHLVLTTLHAQNAYGTILRLLEMGIKRIDLEQTLISVASQQLLPVKSIGIERRAAILELLDNQLLYDAINGNNPSQHSNYLSFDNLRRKAYALGYINEKTFLDHIFY